MKLPWYMSISKNEKQINISRIWVLFQIVKSRFTK